MRKRQNQIALFVILVVTAFSLVVTWPGNPDKYLPSFIPWPSGHGLNIGGFDRDEFRLGLDLAGGVSVTLEATGESVAVRPGETLVEFAGRRDVSIDTLIDLNAELEDLSLAEHARPFPDALSRLEVPLAIAGEELAAAIDQAREVIEERVSGVGISEAEVVMLGADRINVQIPGVTAQEAAQLVGSVAQLEFREIDPANPQVPPPVDPIDVRVTLEEAFHPLFAEELEEIAQRFRTYPVFDPDQDVIVVNGIRWIPAVAVGRDGQEQVLTGEFLIADSIQRDFVGGVPALNFRFDSAGAQLFERITARLVRDQRPLGIFLDGQLISAPSVSAVISERGVITGLSDEDARRLRRQLRAGALPLNLTVIQQTEVAASLGEDSVVDSVQAGLVAFLAIVLFMVLYYRLLGVLAALALLVYVAMLMATFKLVPITLTLAGIAGFVLSLGLAVDANILIFERVKEELRLRRGLQAAIDAGFARAWPAIRDSNVSTLITVAILYFFGDQFNANLIKSFAVALFIGTLFSMVTAILVTRTFLNLTVGFRLGRRPRLFGVTWDTGEEDGRAASRGQREPLPGSGGGD